MLINSAAATQLAGVDDPADGVFESSTRDLVGARWFVVMTLPRQELRAEIQLSQQSFVPFSPRMLRSARHARRFYDTKVPIFPGYIFVKFDPARDRWHPINSTWGVRSLIMANERPLPVPQGIVETIRESCDESGVLRTGVDLGVGQSVRVVHGPLVDLIGRIEQIDAKGRVKILLDIMGNAVTATLPRAQLRAA